MAQDGDGPAFVALVQATAGATGGVFAAFVLMPLEVAKTRIQLCHEGGASTFATISAIAEKEGARGLFRGSFAKCFETGSKNFVYFYIYDAINALAKRHMALTTAVKLVLGYVAGVGNTIATMPLEVLATKVQAEADSRVGVLAVLRQILAKEGILGLFRGFWYNILLCVNPAIQNTCFDGMKDFLLHWKKAKASGSPTLNALEAFILGAVAKAIATGATYPLTRLKTIIQAGREKDLEHHVEPEAPPRQEEKKVGRPHMLKKVSTQDMLREMSIRQDVAVATQSVGQRIAELYRGIGSALLKSVIQAAVLYMTKDQVAGLVFSLFRVTSKALQRRDGRPKLGAFSGRPLAS